METDSTVHTTTVNVFRKFWEVMGVGDADHKINIHGIAMLADGKDGGNFSNMKLYCNWDPVSSEPEFFYATHGGDSSVAQKIISSAMGYWQYSDSTTVSKGNMNVVSGSTMKDVYSALENRTLEGIWYPKVTLSLGENLDAPSLSKELMVEYGGNGAQTIYWVGSSGYVTIEDTTAPTVKDVYTKYPTYSDLREGDILPITVEFSEPVYGDYTLIYQASTTGENQDIPVEGYVSSASEATSAIYGSITSYESLLSKYRTFYYPVRSVDSEGILVLGVKGSSDTSNSDAFFNNFKDFYFDSAKKVGKYTVRQYSVQDTIESMTAEIDDKNPTSVDVTIYLDTLADSKNLWNTWRTASAEDKAFTPSVVLNGDTTKLYTDFSMAEDPITGQFSLNITIPLEAQADGDKPFTAELYLDGHRYYGAYANFTQKAIKTADSTAYVLSMVEDAWPSGEDGITYIQDPARPSFTVTANNTDFTFNDADQLYWKVTPNDSVGEDGNIDEGKLNRSKYLDIVSAAGETPTGKKLTLDTADTVGLELHREGQVKISLWAENSTLPDTQASNEICITIKDDGRPTLAATDVIARQNIGQQVVFTSNLGNADISVTDGKIYGELLDSQGVSLNKYYEVSAASAHMDIPGEDLAQISVGNSPAYILKLTASGVYKDEPFSLETTANIVVRSQPAQISLSGLDDTMFLSGSSINIGWTVANFDIETNPDDCAFELLITRGEEVIYKTTDKADSGGYVLILDAPANLKDYYLITAKAKNGTDKSWSIASRTITVYDRNALDLVIGGSRPDEITLKNSVSSGSTTTSPTITPYGSGKTISGLDNAAAIAAMRTELGLMQSISINYQDYDWSSLYDAMEWSATSTGQESSDAAEELQKIVSINYRSGGFYAPPRKLLLFLLHT